MKKAIVLLSGGLDSTVMLALALEKKRLCRALTFDYHQRHRAEIDAATRIATYYEMDQQIIRIDPTAFAHSSLVEEHYEVPTHRSIEAIVSGPTPNTYVPARNSIFLSYALAQAEIFNAQEIYFGPNSQDHPYPDCRQEFITAYQKMINLSTKQALSGQAPQLITPLIKMNKKEIVAEGKRVQAPLELTLSCYQPTASGDPCSICDACILRESALQAIG